MANFGVFGRSLLLGLCSMCAFMSGEVSSEEFITSGDYCSVRNASTNQASGLRKQNGRIENTLDDFTFTVACPIMIIFDRSEYSVGLTYSNWGTVDQEFKCVLSEYELVGSEKVASYSQKGVLSAGETGGLEFLNIKLTNPYNRLHMWCSLPPRSSLDQLGMGSFH